LGSLVLSGAPHPNPPPCPDFRVFFSYLGPIHAPALVGSGTSKGVGIDIKLEGEGWVVRRDLAKGWPRDGTVRVVMTGRHPFFDKAVDRLGARPGVATLQKKGFSNHWLYVGDFGLGTRRGEYVKLT